MKHVNVKDNSCDLGCVVQEGIQVRCDRKLMKEVMA